LRASPSYLSRPRNKVEGSGGWPGRPLDLTAGALETVKDPARIYLREMGMVPLLTREGEVTLPSASSAESCTR